MSEYKLNFEFYENSVKLFSDIKETKQAYIFYYFSTIYNYISTIYSYCSNNVVVSLCQ